MNVLVTGADGFVGRALVRALLGPGAPEVSSLQLLDRRFGVPFDDARVRTHEGDFFDPGVLGQALEWPVDVAFHLASIPGGTAERDYDLGRRVNLEGTLALFEALRAQAGPPVVVFASTVAVYGSPLPAAVAAATPPRPSSSYGAHKLVGEVVLGDLSRRGLLDGRALRLPGVVARPPGPSGLVSAFMSDAIRRLAAGKPYTCPVSPGAAMWWMSARCCAHNLIHAVTLPAERLGSSRTLLLPALCATMGEVVAGVAELFGQDRLGLARFEPDEAVEAAFGRFPPLDSRAAEALGFRHDGSVLSLIHNSLDKGV